MTVEPGDLKVIHNPEEQRFEIRVEPYLAVLGYRLKGDTIIFTHTKVPGALEGQGVGSRLVSTGLGYARENNLKVKAHCSFVAAYLGRHPEYQDLT
jgi:predicted GNAT family acetyltransferase